MKKVLFIDRDGTLVIEPPVDYQLDSLEKLTFYPGVFRWLGKIVRETDYRLVMVTNQDGLGTEAFPEETFWPAHNKMLEAFANEGITFDEVLIDRSFPADNAPTRKPRTGMVTGYLNGACDLERSFVIGDRKTDIELAQNMGCKGIYLHADQTENAVLNTSEWADIYAFLTRENRTATITRTTSETDIQIALNLNGTGVADMDTGLGFFDHMLTQIARHGNVDLSINVTGDLHVDEHHTIEDVAIALGEAFHKALGSKKGIQRYGFVLPMDDCLAQVAIDFGGRPWLVWDATFNREKIGEMPTEMFEHFFKSFSDGARCNLNIQAAGKNEHHKIEAIFKGLARAIRMAIEKTNNNAIPSTKGNL